MEQLLVVQGHDAAIDRLRHQRSTLPEHQALADCDDEQAHLEAAKAAVVETRHGLEREQKRLEDDVALIEARHQSESDRLYSGTVTAHKDLQAIQAELAVLADRQSAVETSVLEVLEQIDPLDQDIAAHDTNLESVETRRSQLKAVLAEAEGAIDAEIAEQQQARGEAAEGIDAGLLEQYESLRASSGGVGAARLNGKTCEGCHLQLSAVAYDKVRKEPSDAVINCPECRRILVRS